MAIRIRGPRFERVRIETEAQAWELLEQIRSSDHPELDILPTFAPWPKAEFTFWIGGKNTVLTAPVMEAMLDVQAAINRAFMLVSEGSTNLRSLSEEERQTYEAIFKIRRGDLLPVFRPRIS